VKLFKQHAYVVLDEDWIRDVQNGEATVLQDIAEQFATEEATQMIAGDGTTEPKGLDTLTDTGAVQSTGAIASQTLASTTAITYDEVINAIYALAPKYRANATIMASTGTIQSLRQIKDAVTNVPIWSESVRHGEPARFAGVPVVENSLMDAPAATKTALYIGDFSRGIEIVDRTELTLNNYDQTVPGSTVVYARRRNGCNVMDVNAILKVKHAAA
jgi:HK97 family phage major capsid protein